VARRVVSLVRSAPLALRGTDPVLEANAYAVAEAVDLAVVLAGPAVELAVAPRRGGPRQAPSIGGVTLPALAHDQDLRGLLESGVHVYVVAEHVAALGLESAQLVDGVRIVDMATVAAVLRSADAVLAW
jgi:intracellular sulfur oxidation DsrE/DsrF family protein